MKSVSFFVRNCYYPLLWLVQGVLLFSCTPNPIEIDLPPHKSKLVISAQAAPESYFAVHVSKNFSALSGPGDSLATDTMFILSRMVDQAEVKITFNGQTQTLENFGGGLYGSETITQFYGQPYTLSVHDPVSGLSCSAASIMMPAVDFETITPEKVKSTTDTTVFLNFKLRDNLPEKNYYMVTVAGGSRKDAAPWKQIKDVKTPHNNLFLFSDDDFKNGVYEARERIRANGRDTLAVTVSNIGQPYYEYMKLYKKAGNVINQLTGEPVNLPSNIQNGYGFFSAHNPKLRDFYLKEW